MTTARSLWKCGRVALDDARFFDGSALHLVFLRIIMYQSWCIWSFVNIVCLAVCSERSRYSTKCDSLSCLYFLGYHCHCRDKYVVMRSLRKCKRLILWYARFSDGCVPHLASAWAVCKISGFWSGLPVRLRFDCPILSTVMSEYFYRFCNYYTL